MNHITKVRHIPYTDNSGTIESIQPLERCYVETVLGNLTPLFMVEDQGRKKLTPVKYHKNGSVKSVSLQEALEIKTSIGPLSAELITFYPDGALKKVFPLNGKLSGYWTETDEYKLATALTVSTSVGTLDVKPINIQFYETGELKSMTFWPGERAVISTVYGEWTIKTGISFHKDGTLASCEPEKPVSIPTPIGQIKAYDPDPNGLSGDKNSLAFSEKGEVLTCSTIETVINAIDSFGSKYRFQPKVVRSYCSDDDYMVQPLKIEFQRDLMLFRNGYNTSEKLPSSSQYSIEVFTSEKKLVLPAGCA